MSGSFRENDYKTFIDGISCFIYRLLFYCWWVLYISISLLFFTGFPQVSRTLLSIQANPNSTVFWMFCGYFSDFQFFFQGTIPNASTSTGITVSGMFHRFFLFSSKVKIFVYFFILFYSFESFFTPVSADGFSHWSLSESKFPQVSRTLLSILANFNNAVVWIILILPLLSIIIIIIIFNFQFYFQFLRILHWVLAQDIGQWFPTDFVPFPTLVFLKFWWPLTPAISNSYIFMYLLSK